MNLAFLLDDLKLRVAKLEQAALAHEADPDSPALWYCAKDVQVTAKYIARLSERCRTLLEQAPQ